MNILIKATRFALNLARTEPLSAALELRNLEVAPEDGNPFWPGDADPSKVRLVGPAGKAMTDETTLANR